MHMTQAPCLVPCGHARLLSQRTWLCGAHNGEGGRRYTAASAPARHLLEILAELDAGDQRRFLRFVTGSPRLPPGGLGALQPRCGPGHPSCAGACLSLHGSALDRQRTEVHWPCALRTGG